MTSDSLAPILRARSCGRYAPSPTGPLHLGNVRTALLAWLQARLHDATFAMRMEDLDTPRCVAGSAEALLDDLRWLGLDWDEGPDVGGPAGPYEQSARTAIYDAVLDDLEARELAYPCWCSRRDIREAASAPHGRTPVYPGTCRDLDVAGRAARAAANPDRTPAWRFRVAGHGEVAVEDVLTGRYVQSLEQDVGDFVIRRADGLYAYQLAVVVDDWLMGVTDVLRGADLLESTPRQVALFRALGARVPRFWHVPLVLDAEGKRLSKRDGADSLQQLRAAGVRPDAVVGEMAAALGWVAAGTELGATELLAGLTNARFRAALRPAEAL